MDSLSLTTRIPLNLDGCRLDAALTKLFSGIGIRTARRLFETHIIQLNAKPASKGQIVRENDLLSVLPIHDEQDTVSELKPALLACHNDFLAFLKPPAMHCASIKGMPGPSLEAAIIAHAPFFLHTEAEKRPPHTNYLKLLTRLDYETSGIVLAATTPESETLFREQELAGNITKCYLAVVRGALDRELHITNRLDMNKRVKTRVLDLPEPDLTRHTMASPIAAIPDTNTTLVHVRIKRGARHQIRAHLGFMGFPLANDLIYGDRDGIPGCSFLLHHYRMHTPKFTVTAFPDWKYSFQTLIKNRQDWL